MAFSVPGQVLEKLRITLSAATPVSITPNSFSTSINNRKGNALLVNALNVTDARLAIDSGAATAAAGSNPGLDLGTEKMIYVPGVQGSLFSTTGGVVEVFLLSVNTFGR